MTRKFVRLSSEVRCSWSGVVRVRTPEEVLEYEKKPSASVVKSIKPSYRLYVNDELLTERTWLDSKDICLIEELQIDAEPGTYTLRYELINFGDFDLASLHVGPLTATLGDVEVIDQEHFVIKL